MPHKSKHPQGNQDQDQEPEEIGKPHGDYPDREGSELARDKQRTDGGPRYGGGPWELAEERGENERFGKARNDDANPSELASGKQAVDDDEWPGHDASVQTAATDEAEDVADRTAAEDTGATEAGPQHEGMSRGEKPRKPASRAKGRQ